MRRRRGFTLMELLVVVAIIVILTALSIPAISKFLEGQSLTQSGRIVQSAFNEARRAAITQRARNYLVFFRVEDEARPNEFVFGMRRYRERVGYEGETHYLLQGVKFDMEEGTAEAPLVAGTVGKIRGLGIPVYDGQPEETQTGVFTEGRTPEGNSGWVEFQRDGTIALEGLNERPPHMEGESNLFDRNVNFEFQPDAFDALADVVDMNLRETKGNADVDKRCFVDVDPNTGRVRFRVLQVTELGGG